jgi:RHS repeat-associated protein
VVWRWDSEGFGSTLADTDPDGDGTNVNINLRFTGQYYDSESGLHYNYHRYYDPGTGRYLTSDPLGLEGGLNGYVYVGSGPTNSTDALGLIRDRTGPTGYPCVFIGQEGPTPIGFPLKFFLYKVTCHYYCGPDEYISTCPISAEADDYFRDIDIYGFVVPPQCPPTPFPDSFLPA